MSIPPLTPEEALLVLGRFQQAQVRTSIKRRLYYLYTSRARKRLEENHLQEFSTLKTIEKDLLLKKIEGLSNKEALEVLYKEIRNERSY